MKKKLKEKVYSIRIEDIGEENIAFVEELKEGSISELSPSVI